MEQVAAKANMGNEFKRKEQRRTVTNSPPCTVREILAHNAPTPSFSALVTDISPSGIGLVASRTVTVGSLIWLDIYEKADNGSVSERAAKSLKVHVKFCRVIDSGDGVHKVQLGGILKDKRGQINTLVLLGFKPGATSPDMT